ncbi:MAG: NADH-quinone oxidoreductase subunit NuoE [Microvirga sp.]
MAVRRLAPEEIQPKSFAFSPENEVFAQEQIAKYPPGRQASAVIALLWCAQEQAGGWLPRKAIETVAARLDMPDIRVMEVATFYTMFNLDPVGKYFIQFCGTTPCALRGAGEIKKVLERRVGEQSHVSADGNFSWVEGECLGACCNAPMVQINHDYFEDLTADNFEKLLDDLAAGRPVKPGPQSGRRSSEPIDAVKTLTDPALYDGSMVGAWRKRFEEEAVKAVDTGEAAAAAASAASDPKPGKPDAGRLIDSEKADTPAKRVKEGEPPVSDKERKEASDETKTTAVEQKPKGDVPAAQSGKSYVATPSKPDAGRATADSPTTPVAGTPPSDSSTRHDGRESKPDVVPDPTKKSS